MNRKILCIAPYSNYHPLHGLWEMTVLNGLRRRGAEVAYYLCDGLARCCDIFRLAPEQKDCRDCMERSSALARSLQVPYKWLGSMLNTDDERRAEAFAADAAEGEFFQAADGKFLVGQWVRSSVHTYFREAQLDQHDPAVAACYREYLRAGLLYALASERIIKAMRPDVLWLFNSRLAFVKVAAEVAGLHGLHYYAHERGWLPERLAVNRDDIPMSRGYFDEMWRLWGGVPLDRGELETITAVLRGRERGESLNWIAYSPPPGADNLRSQLGIPDGKRLWGLFTSSEDETVSLPSFKPGAFACQRVWVRRVVEFMRGRPDIHLVVRVHPNTGGKKSTGNCLSSLSFFEELKGNLPGNVTVVFPDDPVSTYDLMNAAEAGLVYISTCGLEMACRGKPVIWASQSEYGGSGVGIAARDPEHYDVLLAALADDPPQASMDLMRRAHRFFYSAFFRADFPFPLVSMPDPYTGQLAYASMDDLAEGRDSNLDAICSMILSGGPALRGPSAEQLGRTEQDELEWFAAAVPGRSADMDSLADQR
jgi:hypothetical protein